MAKFLPYLILIRNFEQMVGVGIILKKVFFLAPQKHGHFFFINTKNLTVSLIQPCKSKNEHAVIARF